MSVASLELCKELFELSGWEETEFLWDYKGVLCRPIEKHPLADEAPAYDLGYLMRKLSGRTMWLRYDEDEEQWYASHWTHREEVAAAIPEDAACKLAIELFKQGILTKENA